MALDFLKPVLGEELYQQFAAAMKQSGANINLVDIASGNFIPKAKFDEKLNQIHQLTEDLNAKQAELDAEKQKLGTVDTLQKQIDQLTQDIAAKDTALHDANLDYRIKDELRALKVKDVNIVVPLLKRDQITEKDGKLNGFTEQVDALKKSAPYLFDLEQQQRGGFNGQQDIIGTGGNETTNAAMNNALRQALGRA